MRELPEVTSPRPGVWSIPVPIPGTSLGWVFVYALVGDAGTWLVDAGWDTPDSREALEAGLVTAGSSLPEVDGVLVTHVHADHFGLAGWIRAHSDAWVAMHPADTAQVHDRYVDPDALLGRGDSWLRSAGVPEDVVAALRDASLQVLANVVATEPDRAVHHGQLLVSPIGELRVVHTPGHTPGHVCIDAPGAGVVFTGDHVLVRVSPLVGHHPQSGPDPLGDYLRSLDVVADLGAPHALPGHVHPFDVPAERARELQAEHADELDDALAVVADGAATAWEVATQMSWARPWPDLAAFDRRAAVAEASAHLVRLEHEGRVACDRARDVHTWRAVDG